MRLFTARLLLVTLWLTGAIILFRQILPPALCMPPAKAPSPGKSALTNLTGTYRNKQGSDINELKIIQKGNKISFSLDVSEGNGDRVGGASGEFLLQGERGRCKSSDNDTASFEFKMTVNKITIVDHGECFFSGVHGDGVYIKREASGIHTKRNRG